jgi:hypothetical protein
VVRLWAGSSTGFASGAEPKPPAAPAPPRTGTVP